MIKLKNLLEDSSAEIAKIVRTRNGLISPNGNVYNTTELSHADFLVKQPKYKDFASRLKKAKGDDWTILYHSILDDALNDGWIRITVAGGIIMVNGKKDAIKKQRKIINDIIFFVEAKNKRQMDIRWDYIK